MTNQENTAETSSDAMANRLHAWTVSRSAARKVHEDLLGAGENCGLRRRFAFHSSSCRALIPDFPQELVVFDPDFQWHVIYLLSHQGSEVSPPRYRQRRYFPLREIAAPRAVAQHYTKGGRRSECFSMTPNIIAQSRTSADREPPATKTPMPRTPATPGTTPPRRSRTFHTATPASCCPRTTTTRTRR